MACKPFVSPPFTFLTFLTFVPHTPAELKFVQLRERAVASLPSEPLKDCVSAWPLPPRRTWPICALSPGVGLQSSFQKVVPDGTRLDEAVLLGAFVDTVPLSSVPPVTPQVNSWRTDAFSLS